MSTTITYRGGVTLTEVLVATALAGMVLVAALDTLGGAARSHVAASSSSAAWSLAEVYAAEALAAAYEEPSGAAVFGIESGDGAPATRAGLDDVDDYHNWTEAPPKSRDGVPVAGYTGWSVRCLVDRLDSTRDNGDAAVVATDQGVKRLRVEVTDSRGRVYRLDALRSREGAGELDPALSLPQVSGLSIDLTAGGAPRQQACEQHLNEAPTP